MTDTDYLGLCICHHFEDQHDTLHRDGVRVVNPPCTLCHKCQGGFCPVSHASSHVYQRGAVRVVRRFDQLHTGHWVLVRYNGKDMGLTVAGSTADALVAKVTSAPVRDEPKPEDRYHPAVWIWSLETDLGPLTGVLGKTPVMTVKVAAFS